MLTLATHRSACDVEAVNALLEKTRHLVRLPPHECAAFVTHARRCDMTDPACRGSVFHKLRRILWGIAPTVLLREFDHAIRVVRAEGATALGFPRDPLDALRLVCEHVPDMVCPDDCTCVCHTCCTECAEELAASSVVPASFETGVRWGVAGLMPTICWIPRRRTWMSWCDMVDDVEKIEHADVATRLASFIAQVAVGHLHAATAVDTTLPTWIDDDGVFVGAIGFAAIVLDGTPHEHHFLFATAAGNKKWTAVLATDVLDARSPTYLFPVEARRRQEGKDWRNRQLYASMETVGYTTFLFHLLLRHSDPSRPAFADALTRPTMARALVTDTKDVAAAMLRLYPTEPCVSLLNQIRNAPARDRAKHTQALAELPASKLVFTGAAHDGIVGVERRMGSCHRLIQGMHDHLTTDAVVSVVRDLNTRLLVADREDAHERTLALKCPLDDDSLDLDPAWSSLIGPSDPSAAPHALTSSERFHR